jgi:hypothetical protein
MIAPFDSPSSIPNISGKDVPSNGIKKCLTNLIRSNGYLPGIGFVKGITGLANLSAGIVFNYIPSPIDNKTIDKMISEGIKNLYTGGAEFVIITATAVSIITFVAYHSSSMLTHNIQIPPT